MTILTSTTEAVPFTPPWLEGTPNAPKFYLRAGSTIERGQMCAELDGPLRAAKVWSHQLRAAQLSGIDALFGDDPEYDRLVAIFSAEGEEEQALTSEDHTLSTKGALDQIRILGAAVDQARQASADATKADAAHVITVERADARTSQEVSADVLQKLDRVQAELAASRSLAADRLQQLAQARADQGSGGAPAGAEDPDATCRAAFAADCDGVLALLAAGERQTAQLVGWQAWWASIVANHAADDEARQ